MTSLKRFKSECKGSVAAIFAIAVIPLLVGSGIALDYSRAASRRNALQSALDSAVLSVARESGTLTPDQMNAKITAYIKSVYGETGLNPIAAPTVQSGSITATVSASVPTTIMNVVGIKNLQISVTTKSSWSLSDVVIAVDVSNGMGTTNLNSVKSGLTTLINKVGSDGTVQVGLVPYATRVRVVAATYKNEPWICYGEDEDEEPEEPADGEDGLCEDEDMFNRNLWTGYITDRPSTHDQNDTYYNNQTQKKYPAVKTAASGESNLATVMPLTSNTTALAQHVGTFTAGGGTNGTIGVSWGHSLLSTIIPFNQVRPTSRKILIIVAGSANTKSRHTWNSGRINTRMLASCTAAKTAGIEIYTIRLGGADATTLQNCASSAAHYTNAANGAAAQTALANLVVNVRYPKLTH